MLFLRVSHWEIFIVLAVILLTFCPYFLKRDVERIRTKYQVLENTMVSHMPVVLLLLAANMLLLLLHFWVH